MGREILFLGKQPSMMKHLIFIAISCCSVNIAGAQCNAFFPMKENIKYYYDHYDKKEQLSLRTTQSLKDIKETGNSITAIMVQEMIDAKKGKSIATTEAEWACHDGILHFAINNMAINGAQQPVASGMTMDVTGDKMDLPSHLEIGQTLKDLTYGMKMAMQGMTLMNTTYKITERKVETKEQVTTPAGTFDCYKLTYTTTSSGGVGSGTMKSASWFAENIGLVKTETFSEKGKLIGRQILTKIEK
jgi:hypothetical protein